MFFNDFGKISTICATLNSNNFPNPHLTWNKGEQELLIFLEFSFLLVCTKKKHSSTTKQTTSHPTASQTNQNIWSKLARFSAKSYSEGTQKVTRSKGETIQIHFSPRIIYCCRKGCYFTTQFHSSLSFSRQRAAQPSSRPRITITSHQLLPQVLPSPKP